ncbi:hypothetical protein FEM33_03420 [Dyadobacter flavalbus]|uniref:DUF5723 domain-containing protein n=1 Tax=Dyadobacter flavalbus TaxID=2579942 RepID=A0A5M8R2H1_9BACT|nr:DUF5723 family protein [Dyadobacter flavalbus]KAA6441184.1 hypothetical protein FEM33_03420 [Dyadobacter flavalbus]
MKRLYFFFLMLAGSSSFAQFSTTEFNRYELTNTFYNPAVLQVPESHKWSAHYASLYFRSSANTARFSLFTVFHNDLLRGSILGIKKPSSGYAEIGLIGPSFAIRLDEKTSIAVTTRSRVVANYSDVIGRLISEIGETAKKVYTYPSHIVAEKDMRMNTAVFNDLGLSVSRTLLSGEHVKIRGGATLRYINGVANSSMLASDLVGTIKKNKTKGSYFTDATGKVSAQTSGNFLAEFGLLGFLKPRKASVGADFGLVYEYYEDLKQAPKLTIMASVTDIGKVRYKPDPQYSKSYDIGIPSNMRLYFNNSIKFSSFSHTTKIYDKYSKFFKQTDISSKQYSYKLPMMIRFKLHYAINDTYSVLVDAGTDPREKDFAYNLHSPAYAGIVPTWRNHKFRLSVPVSYQEYAGINIGAGVKYKRFYFGSSSLISALFRSKQIDAQIGMSLVSGNFK